MLKISLLALLFLTLVSCGTIKKVIIASTGSVIYDASFEVLTENNFETFRKGVPGNIKLIEGFWSLSKDDEDLLVSLIKGYAGYGFAVDETLFLKDLYGDVENSSLKEQAILHYSKALDYGLYFLKLNDVSFDQLVKKMKDGNGIVNLLDSELDDEGRDIEAILFIAQSLSSLINLQKDKLGLVAYLPIAKGLFDFACLKQPDINYGMCDIFYAAYEAGRPRMLGGNPARGKEIFLKAIGKYPNNWLIRVAFIQFYLIPMSDDFGYKDQKSFLEEAKIKFDKHRKWYPPKLKEKVVVGDEKVRFYQAIALKRFEIIKKFEADFF